MDIIKKTLIAGILIQASRFLMAALIDISTIATYAVWWLPLSVLKDTDIGKQKILMVNGVIDLDQFTNLWEKWKWFDVRHSATFNGKPIKISSCKVEDSWIIGREMMSPEYRNIDAFTNTPYANKEICMLFGNQLVLRDEIWFMNSIGAHRATAELDLATSNRQTSEGHYWSLITAFINQSWRQNTDSWWINDFLVNINTWGTDGKQLWSDFKKDPLLVGTTISNIINKSKWFVGPLVMMYSSLLNFSELADTNTTNIWETSGIFLIKTLIAIALFFPLLALSVVLIARIGLLWLYIAASPFLILKKVFGDVIPKIGEFDKHLELGNVIKLIFAPVVTVAALSISLIFMTALIEGFKTDDNKQMSSDLAENLQMIPTTTAAGHQSFQVAWAVELEFAQFDRWGSLDWFSRLIVNFFAIALLWTIVFAAIKANAVWAGIGKTIQDFGEGVFTTLPILPYGPWGERVGIGAAYNTFKDRPAERVEARENKQLNDVQKWYNDEGTKQNATLNDTQFNEVFDKIHHSTGDNATEKQANAQKSVTDYLATQNINSTMPEVAKANSAKFYNAMKNLPPTQRDIIFTNVPEMKTEYNALAKADIATNIVNVSNIPESTAEWDIDTKVIDLNNPNNKKYLDNYFTTTNERTYTTTLWTNKQLTITADDTNPWNFSYTWKITSITQTQTK